MTITKITSKIKEVKFPTNANGLVSCMLLVNPLPELEELECGGVGFGIGTYIYSDNTLPFKEGDEVVMHFDGNGEIVNHAIHSKKKGFTKLPKKCVACGHLLRQIKENNTVTGLLCGNLIGCTAQSTSPIYRLAAVAVGGLGIKRESYQAFVNEYPEAPLTHLSDLKIFMKSDPNTAPREALWNDKDAWKIEVAVWRYLHETEMSCQYFWRIGFNTHSNLGPRDVLQDSLNLSHPDIIKSNIDRVSQLVGFFDHWVRKDYAPKAM